MHLLATITSTFECFEPPESQLAEILFVDMQPTILVADAVFLHILDSSGFVVSALRPAQRLFRKFGCRPLCAANLHIEALEQPANCIDTSQVAAKLGSAADAVRECGSESWK